MKKDLKTQLILQSLKFCYHSSCRNLNQSNRSLRLGCGTWKSCRRGWKTTCKASSGRIERKSSSSHGTPTFTRRSRSATMARAVDRELAVIEEPFFRRSSSGKFKKTKAVHKTLYFSANSTISYNKGLHNITPFSVLLYKELSTVKVKQKIRKFYLQK